MGLGVVGLVRAVRAARRLERHLRRTAPERWRAFYGGPRGGALRGLWPFGTQSPAGFVWRSREDYGDAEIARLRTETRTMFVGAVFALVASFVWWGVAVVVLSSR